MNTIKFTRITGEDMGTMTFKSSVLVGDSTYTKALIGHHRSRGLSDSEIFDKFRSWSNGYVATSLVESDD